MFLRSPSATIAMLPCLLLVRAALADPYARDNCADAQAIPASLVEDIDTSTATSETGDPDLSECTFGAGYGHSFWYAFTAPAGQPGQIHATASTAEQYVLLAILSGNCGSLNSLACDWNVTSPAEATLCLSGGQRVLILVAAFDGEDGGATHFTFSFTAGTTNDVCTAAKPIATATFQDSVSTLCGGPWLGPTCGYAGPTRAVWYAYTPAEDGAVSIDTCGSSYGTIVSVFTGTCNALQQVACEGSTSCSQG